jgi:membrane-bound metal-dependent hydrolase YbcI (DUF457 family)
MMLLAGRLGYAWLWWLGWGYVWHILGDLLTKSGVPLLGPFSTVDIKFSPIRTGTWPEYLIQLGCWLVVGHWGYGYMPPQAQYWLWQIGVSLKALVLN